MRPLRGRLKHRPVAQTIRDLTPTASEFAECVDVIPPRFKSLSRRVQRLTPRTGERRDVSPPIFAWQVHRGMAVRDLATDVAPVAGDLVGSVFLGRNGEFHQHSRQKQLG